MTREEIPAARGAPPLRVVIVDDHPVVRAGLRAVVGGEPDVDVVADLPRGEDVLAMLARGETCDVVLMDLRMGEGALGGAEATRLVREAGGPPVVILTTYDSDADILAALGAGAAGYLLKDAPTAELVAAVRDAAAGRTTLDPAVQRRLVDRVRSPEQALTAREVEVLGRVAAGESNEAIAAALFLSRATVKTHLVHIYAKLGVDSRTAAVAKARSRGVLPP